MRTILFSLLLVGLSLSPLAQSIPFFISEYGGNVPDRKLFDNNTTLIADEGTFVQVFTRTALNGLNDDVVLYKYDPISVSVTDSIYLGNDDNQLAGAVFAAEDDFLYVLASSTALSSDNLYDLVLYKLTNELELVETTTYDRSRYDGAVFLGSGGPGRLSMLVGERDEFFGDDQYVLVTISLATGDVISEIDLPGANYGSRNNFIINDGGDNLLIGNSSVYFSFSGTLTGVDVGSEDLNFFIESIPEAECPDFGELITTSAIYNPERNVFALAYQCGSVLEIIPENGFVNVENIEEPFLNNSPAWIQTEDNGFVMYASSGIYEIETSTDGYSRGATQQFTDGFMPIPSVAVDEGVFAIYNQFAVPRLVFIDDEGFEVADVNGFGYASVASGTTSEFVYHDKENDELVTMMREGSRSVALFYDYEGNLLDSFLLSETRDISATNFTEGPDGSIVTLLTVASPLSIQNVFSFNRQTGESEVLATIQSDNPLAFYFNRIERAADGGYVLMYLDFLDAGGTAKYVARISADGDLIYAAELPNDLAPFEFTPMAVDAANNFYTAIRVFGEGFRLVSYDENGFLRFNTLIGDLEEVNSMELNANEDRLLLGGGTYEGEACCFGYVAELNPTNGEILRDYILNDERAFEVSNVAAYEPGADTILVMNTRFRGDDVPVDEQRALQFSIIDETGIAFQRDVFIGDLYDVPTIRDMVVTGELEAYGSGSTFRKEQNSTQSVLTGVDYDDLVAVEEVEDLAETAELTVSPNPVVNNFHVQWDNNEAGDYQLELSTADGRLMSRWRGQIARGRASLRVDLQGQPAGTYLIRLSTESGVTSQRIVKQ